MQQSVCAQIKGTQGPPVCHCAAPSGFMDGRFTVAELRQHIQDLRAIGGRLALSKPWDLPEFLRVTVGLAGENDAFIQNLKQLRRESS